MALVAASCGDDDSESSDTEAAATTAGSETTVAPEATEAPDGTDAPETTDAPEATEAPEATDAPETTENGEDGDGGDGGTAASAVFPTLPPPTGEAMKIGLVNTEGTPGLDFPDIRINVGATFDYLNEHGGYGERPLELVNCTVDGSPEASQACAQEIVGEGVELVFLGLDLFPDYATYTASDIPVVGLLPILPGDYTADALFYTGGNATTNGAIAAGADQEFEARSVGIISADNAGANASEASLTAALDIAGIEYTSIKGGDNETDAGYQGLMRQAADGNPDVLVSLYADAGCIGTMRGRAALGIDIPVITTGICGENDVIDEVGDDALGWYFVGIETDDDSPEQAILREILAPVFGVPADEVTAEGLGALALNMAMSFAVYSNQLAAEGGDVTGRSLYEFFETAPGLQQWPDGSVIECGRAPPYPAVCAFTFPVAEYQAGGEIVTAPGLEAVDAFAYLP